MDAKPLLINGKHITTGNILDVTCPWNGELVGRCCLAGKEETELALDAGYAAKDRMKSLHNWERAEILHCAADILHASIEEFARLIALEGGKPIREARAEAARGEATFRLAAEAARSWGGEVLPLDVNAMGGDRIALVKRFPRGLVTGITPFNFPLNLVAHKVAPAIATGCAINIKPASSTPLTALKLGDVLLKAGLPDGAFNVLPMSSRLAEPLITDPRVKVITFTGSAAVGWGIKAKAVDKMVCLELGGNAAAIVEPDCDLEHALNRIIVGGYAHTGQICISIQNVLVHEEIFDEFLKRYIPLVENLKMGDPLVEESRLSAMIDESEAIRIGNWIKEAVESGAKLHCGGKRNANRLQPAVLSNVPNDAKIMVEEAFAPVTVVSAYRNLEEAIEIVNSWKFGLQAGVFTRDINKAMMAYNRLDVGGVVIDEMPTFRVDNFPYGGVKQSGFGREGVKYAMEEMSELKTLVIPSPK